MYKRFLKRFLDIILSLTAIILLSPIYLVTAILVTCKLGRPVIFCQERPGKNGKIFRLFKFRSMSNAKDENGELLPDSQRLTRFGRILRATSLDELPELVNILKGDMSIVGPRPLAVSYLPYYNEQEKHRHDVLPGLTGMAQINGRNAINWPDRFAYDLYYVEHLSFALDVSIIWKTIWKVLKRSDISVRGTTKVVDFSTYRQQQWDDEKETTK